MVKSVHKLKLELAQFRCITGELFRLLKRRFPESEYHVPLFDELGYVRKQCPRCGEWYWTQNPDQPTCGESNAEGCATLTFIGNPATRRRYSFPEMGEAFLSFFEKRGHERIRPYPVASRWRTDLYFTSASIVDFQPYVTNGIIPPPANPLVVNQPCIRLVDIDNVGPTFGRHLSIFTMGGHHAFNYPDREVYWKDRTVRYHHEFLTQDLGVRPEEIIYKEDVWAGGGNAGPDLETIVRGCEIDTLVFMKFKVVDNEFVELPIRTVDTGYGIERYAWISQGSPSAFHTVYGRVLDHVLQMAGLKEIDGELLKKVAEQSGSMVLGKTASRQDAREKVAKSIGLSVEELNRKMDPVQTAFTVVDHTKCLAFMLSEGVVPSNVQEGYLTRLMIRRTYRLLRNLGIEGKLYDIVDEQIDLWAPDFKQLREMRDEILTMLSVEQKKYMQTLQRGNELAKRLTRDLKAKGIKEMPEKILMEFYDSHGLPPEVVAETVDKEGIPVKVPEDFYAKVVAKHLQAPPTLEEEPIKGLDQALDKVPFTKTLYYEDPYIKEFEAKVLLVPLNNHVVLDQTAFYPEGGGQPADHGVLKFDGVQSEVVDVQKIGNVIVHVIKGHSPREGETVTGRISWDRRISLMRHHTATHVIMGAARRVLGQHVWQSGAQKEVETSRLDISHYQRLTTEEIHKIEELANEAVMQMIPVETSFEPRIEAEKKYGFRLYQGGAVPGKEIRVVKTGDWEVQACGGTHVKNTGEIGLIRILRTERIQDGVERITFSAGIKALKAVQKDEGLLTRVSEKLNAPLEKLEPTADKLITECKEIRREREKLVKELAELASKEYLAKAKDANGLKMIMQSLKEEDMGRLIQTANEIIGKEPKAVVVLCATNKTARLVVMAGKDSLRMGINARQIADEAASLLGGGGSGRPEFAQGGGTQTDRISEAMKKAEETIKKQVQSK
jgi:alanyl-tRNA synthetase